MIVWFLADAAVIPHELPSHFCHWTGSCLPMVSGWSHAMAPPKTLFSAGLQTVPTANG